VAGTASVFLVTAALLSAAATSTWRATRARVPFRRP